MYDDFMLQALLLGTNWWDVSL